MNQLTHMGRPPAWAVVLVAVLEFSVRRWRHLVFTATLAVAAVYALGG